VSPTTTIAPAFGIGALSLGLRRPIGMLMTPARQGIHPSGRTRHFRSSGQTGRTINLATTAARDPKPKSDEGSEAFFTKLAGPESLV
jgi:hypothetical protein